ncbi:hypothetical protein Fuma_01221 [Fuerstiella marisgermanici]|uniref:Right handed beta helix domain-containing protein n=2 Tax=Fuerstiella marisgermanici TaxID=1891926 RepID=A0A1P8WC64_9PLAN|nr:hypothetical protein Fuma_01221 [Fuerstiella marisgermanici]
MKTNRSLASCSLALSCFALLAAANVSVGDQTGVVRMTAGQISPNGPPPVPPESAGSASAPVPPPPVPMPEDALPPLAGNPGATGAPTQSMGVPMHQSMPRHQGMMPAQGIPTEVGGSPMYQHLDYSPYFERSAAVTEAPVLGRRPNATPLFGPQLMFESNIDDGLGFDKGYHTLNAKLPYHVVPGSSVLMADLSASVTNDERAVYNFGAVWRNYDASRNRIFGWNVFGDIDDGRGNNTWNRVGFGVESLGKYIDFRANGYRVTGDDSVLLNDQLVGDLSLSGNSVFRVRNQVRDNAYSGADWEIGGPLPVLGRRGANMYLGGYWLDNDMGHEALGFSARWELLVTESATVNMNYTTDDTFGTNSWVSVSYSIPNYRERAILQPRSVRDRLPDPVQRSNRVHTNIDQINVLEALVNQDKGRAYHFVYVDPDSTSTQNGGNGLGTLENPYTNLQYAAANNNAGIDVIRIDPRGDDTGQNLTVPGGIDLFDCQVLLSSTKDFTLFSDGGMDFIIPGEDTATGLGPLVSDPNMIAGNSVIRLANQNSVVGLRIDASNTAMTAFGTGISNPLPITDANIVMNTFTNYETAVNLQDASGDIIFDENNADGLPGVAMSGLVLTTANGSMTNLLVRNNIATNNGTVGISVTAGPNSTVNADNPNGNSAGGAVAQTGIVGNTVTNGGEGIAVNAQAGSTVNAVVQNNTSTGNTTNGFSARSDAATFNLASMSGNTFSSNLENGAFLHYLNGGTFRAVSEDLNGDGLIDPGEDLNGNGLLDQGIVLNTMNNNTIAGLCIFGEDDSSGVFDIGGPNEALGNTFIGNNGAGIATDLKDTATAQIDALFNTVSGGSGDPGLTFVLDFIDPGQAPLTDFFGFQMNTFDVTNFGFAATDFDLVTNAILETVQSHYRDIPTQDIDPNSPIPAGQELDIDFVIGDSGVAPSNGATEYYVIGLGDLNQNLGGLLGIAGNIGNVRDGNGVGPNVYIDGITPQALGGVAASTFTDQFLVIDSLVNPPGALTLPDGADGPRFNPEKSTEWGRLALTSGNLTATREAIAGTTSHEIGHTIALRHIGVAGSVTSTGKTPVMSTGAIDAGIQSFIEPHEFAYSGQNPGELAGEAPFNVFPVQELINSVGLRTAGAETRNGIAINATGDSKLLPSTFNNNTITGASEHGINVSMSDNARAEGLTIQGNAITNGGGHGIRLAADGNAFIDADNTIGGSGTNTYRGDVFSQGNTISNNDLDGFRALASNGGVIHGNLINNQITDNGRNGASLYVENGGVIDFGTTPDRVITGNTITGNGGIGIELISNVSASTTGQIDAVIRNNDISNNTGGGIVSSMTGPNIGGATNNLVNLTVGGTSDQANTITGNGNVGIGFSVAGTAKGVFNLSNSTISGTTDGADPLTDGDGIYLRRTDSSLLTANISNVTSSGNAGSGLRVDVQGNDKNDPNQPMSGTINTVNWDNNLFTNNGVNGALFRVRGDAQLLADGTNNVVTNNAQHGIEITTSENSSFGDPTDGLPPGRRTLIAGTTATGNGVDGISINATESSRVLAEITSNRTPGSTGAHAALNTNGDSSFSNNGSDGIHITTTGGASDVLITSGTGTTTISGNGTTAGGNGIRWDSSGTSDAIVRVTKTNILNNIAGAVEDPANNGNGVLDAGEDINGNGVLDTGEDGSNDNIDVAHGDGIQFNVFDRSRSTLIVGGAAGDGNFIQNNQDDGIAIAAAGQGLNVSRPIITISNNLIGGERDGVAAGNGGDGVSMNIAGGTDDSTRYGGDPANLDTDIDDGDGLTFSNGVTESGPIVQLTLTDNKITRNSERGVNLLLNGAAGERDREFNQSFFDPVRITLTGNEIASNGTEGIFFRADTDMNQSRLTYLANFPFPDPPFNPANDRPQGFSFYDPAQPQFQQDNNNTVGGKAAFADEAPDGERGFLNLRTVQNSFLTVTGNTVQNNGVGTVTGEGLVLSIGTGAYLAADIQNNTFGGNLEEDVRTESFLSFGNTFDSVDDSGDLTFDAIYHDDTAQLDMRFVGNSGNQISLSSDGASYRNRDALKEIVLGFTPTDLAGVTDRDAAFFQIDDGPNLDNPNNAFINFGITQDIDGAFATGGFNIRGAADPLFPNIQFAPFLP